MKDKEYSYKGDIFFFKNGKWYGKNRVEVSQEMGRELAIEFDKGMKEYLVFELPKSEPVKYYDHSIINVRTIPGDTNQPAVTSTEERNTEQGKTSSQEESLISHFSNAKLSQFKSVRIEELDISAHVVKMLKRSKITMLDQLLRMSENEILALREIGDKSMKEIYNAIRSYMLKFSPEDIPEKVEIESKEPKKIENHKRNSLQVKKEEKSIGEELEAKETIDKAPIAKECNTNELQVKENDDIKHDAEVRVLKGALAVACCVILILLCKLIMVYYF